MNFDAVRGAFMFGLHFGSASSVASFAQAPGPFYKSRSMNVLDRARALGASMSRITERWVPDAWVICMALTSVVILMAVFGAGAGLEETVLAWGDGVWSLLALTMQFTIALVAAHACVASGPMFRALDRLASVPNPDKPRQAVLLAGLFSIITGYINGGVCTVGSALLVPFLARRNPNTDIRVLIAAAYLGLGTVWHGGLSGSVPLILATPDNPLLAPISGEPVVDRIYPVTETLFNAFNVTYLLVIAATALAAVTIIHPDRDRRTLTKDEIDAILPTPPEDDPPATTPAEKFDRFPGWTVLAAILIAYPLGHSIVTRGFGVSWTINAYNAVFLATALLLHRRPLPFLRACRQGVDATWGMILQFPFYGGIFGIMQKTELGHWLGEVFSTIAYQGTFPLLVYLYSGFMNVLVPSAGTKWFIEAPYLVPLGHDVDVSTITTVLAYMYGDSTTNLIQPMWAIPILAVTRMRFGDIVGYTFLVAMACLVVSCIAMLLIPVNM